MPHCFPPTFPWTFPSSSRDYGLTYRLEWMVYCHVHHGLGAEWLRRLPVHFSFGSPKEPFSTACQSLALYWNQLDFDFLNALCLTIGRKVYNLRPGIVAVTINKMIFFLVHRWHKRCWDLEQKNSLQNLADQAVVGARNRQLKFWVGSLLRTPVIA